MAVMKRLWGEREELLQKINEIPVSKVHVSMLRGSIANLVATCYQFHSEQDPPPAGDDDTWPASVIANELERMKSTIDEIIELAREMEATWKS